MDSASGNIQSSPLPNLVPKNEPEENSYTLREDGSASRLQTLERHPQRKKQQQDNGRSTSVATVTAGSGDDQQSSKDDHDSSSRRVNAEGTSVEDQDSEHASKRPRRHRHTPEQVQMLESVFKYCPLPDRKLRQDLSESLGMNEMQVKFWFQNRRIQMKAIRERSDNAQLRAEIKRMSEENMSIREAINQQIPSFTDPSSAHQQDIDGMQRRRIESSRLREELEHAMPKSVAWSTAMISSGSQFTPPIISASPDSLSLELAVGRHPTTQWTKRETSQASGLLLDARKVDSDCTVANVIEQEEVRGPKHESNLAVDGEGASKNLSDRSFWKSLPGVQKPGQRVEAANGFWKTPNIINLDSSVSGHVSQDEQDNGCGKHVDDIGSGDDQDDDEAWKKKSYRHTAEQIHQLEMFFKRCAHPDQRQREQLSNALGLNSRQVKFWFQNRRNQMKTLQERHDNTQLRAEVDRLRAENVTIREAIKHHLASCSESASIQQEPMDEHRKVTDSAWLREEVEHAKGSAPGNQGVPRMAVAFSDSLSLELGVGRRPTLRDPSVGGRGEHQQQSQCAPTLLEVALSWPGGISGTEKAAVLDLAESALQEIVIMVQAEEPLWVKKAAGDQPAVSRLDPDAYMKRFPGWTSKRLPELVTEATRETGLVAMNSSALLDALMDANKWMVMFPSIIAKALTIKVLSPGTAATLDGALQLMYAELQVLSPLLQSRQMYFLRYCKRIAEKQWAIVDASMDCLRDNPPSCLLQCRRRPSGCIIQDMPNGLLQVTWLEHVEVDYHGCTHKFVPFLSNGSAFGAKRWISALERYCEDRGSLLVTNMLPMHELGVVNTLEGRRAMLRLAKKMMDKYCSNVSSTANSSWVDLSNASGSSNDDVRFTTKDNSGDGILLCAVTSTWLPFYHNWVFDYLRSEEYRAQRNVLANGSAQEMSRISKGQHPGNGVSLLRVNGPSQSNILILQESWTDESGSLLVYMPVDVSTFTRVLRGEDPLDFLLLPSGFAIMPDGPVENRSAASVPIVGDGSSGSNVASKNSPRGSLLTVSFQTVVSPVPPSGSMISSASNPVSNVLLNTMESMKTVSKIILNTLQHIQTAVEGSKV
ncbi:hypothetical protein KP509_04G065600 [Ceratopteris richardii]|nr:hypothetical protein KP509_04G065600 [Ceratopteris richardii]KAH7439520.1 hypothetical protein KP509_04G065600 [Ceratopteris richardii]KAH7439521.1 hypothetical protein KP509_04G065600 [Ceratopteris richardii]KAH7439523.1 hypothetical protein KP509_04G065600 [Ceratopteris richardii]KAH7439524.1 hypothetical protein KP509_04G065600 [Ceratopteris richardii]